MKKYYLMAAIGSIRLVACNGGGSKGNSTNATLNFNLATSDEVTTQSKQITLQDKSLKVVSNIPSAPVGSITSGNPSQMIIYVKSMSLINSTQTSQEFIFKSDSQSGTPITIRNGNVDISQLFQAKVNSAVCYNNNDEVITYNGQQAIIKNLNSGNVKIYSYQNSQKGSLIQTVSCQVSSKYGLSIPAGTYSMLQVEYATRSKMSGCVTGNFNLPDTNPSFVGKHTFCTQSALDTFTYSAGGKSAYTASQFENVNPQLMNVDLQIAKSANSDINSGFEVTYPIQGDITLTPGSSASLTMAFDQSQSGKTPTHSALGGTAYFFSLTLGDPDSASFVFVGNPGSVKSYQITLDACNTQPVPANRLCASGSTPNLVGVWMTGFYYSDGSLIRISYFPDDDNAWTVMKGSTSGVTNPVNTTSNGT